MKTLNRIDSGIHGWLRAHSITLLRVSVGLVILAFGVLKFFPDVSPAEELTIKTTDALTFDLVPGHIAIVVVATLETILGLLLISGRFLRLAIYLLAGQLIGVLAPLALFTGRLFAGPHNAPTLEGQYVMKDIIIVAAGFVVASTLPGLCRAPTPRAPPAANAAAAYPDRLDGLVGRAQLSRKLRDAVGVEQRHEADRRPAAAAAPQPPREPPRPSRRSDGHMHKLLDDRRLLLPLLLTALAIAVGSVLIVILAGEASQSSATPTRRRRPRRPPPPAT